MVEFRLPEEGATAVWPGHRECYSVRVRTFLLPEVDAQVPLILEGIVEHELTGCDAAFADLLRGAIGDDGDVITALLQAQR